MASKTGKTYASYYGNDLSISQTSNTGVDATSRTIIDGFNNSTAISLSTRAFQVKPSSNSTQTSTVQNVGGSNILAVDTNNSKVLVGASQVAANTHYKQFNAINIVPQVGYHMALQANASGHYDTLDLAEKNLGNGAEPATTYDMSSGNDVSHWIPLIWRIVDNITVDAVDFLVGSSGTTTDTYNVHLSSFTIDTDNGSTSGDLSAGVVVADSSTVASDRTAIDYLTCTVQSADVDAGKVLVATLESDGTDIMSISMNVKYHIR